MKVLTILAYLLLNYAGASTNKTTTVNNVYVTAHGGKYHTHKDCRYLKGKDVKTITIAQAKSQEKTLCKACQVKDLLSK